MNGFLNIYKPRGMSSAHCLNKIKKKIDYKCGHMGTLDPLACGILPVGVGQATRLFDHLLDKRKVYIAEFTFGYETDTLDPEGKVTFSQGRIPSISEIEQILPSLCGEIMQKPPVFSAKCVDGKKSYTLARKGIEVDLPAKRVEIYSIKLISSQADKFKFEIACGGGTYIRSICRDLAHGLNTYATMTALERVQSGYFTIENCVTLDDFLASNNPKDYLINSADVLSYKKFVLTLEQGTRLLNGLYDHFDLQDGKYSIYCEEEFWGVGTCESGKIVIKPYVRG